MLMKARERWHCMNPGCGCQVVVEIGGEVEGNIRAARVARLWRENTPRTCLLIWIFFASKSPPQHKRNHTGYTMRNTSVDALPGIASGETLVARGGALRTFGGLALLLVVA